MPDISGIVDQAAINKAVEETKDPKANKNGTGFDPDMFLKILMSQLQNQSPFDTVDTSEILQQQATLTQVEQSTRQSASVDQLRSDVAQNFAILNQTLTEIKDLL